MITTLYTIITDSPWELFLIVLFSDHPYSNHHNLWNFRKSSRAVKLWRIELRGWNVKIFNFTQIEYNESATKISKSFKIHRVDGNDPNVSTPQDQSPYHTSVTNLQFGQVQLASTRKPFGEEGMSHTAQNGRRSKGNRNPTRNGDYQWSGRR